MQKDEKIAAVLIVDSFESDDSIVLALGMVLSKKAM